MSFPRNSPPRLPDEAGVICSFPMESGPSTSSSFTGPAVLRYGVPGFLDTWTVTEVPVPEAAWHSAIVRHLEALLLHWVARGGHDGVVYRNLAIRVREEQPKVGFDPDLCFVTPAPPTGEEISSLCLWKAGHVAPALCIEVVSPSHPHKDYVDIPARCAAVGVRELWVFDPKLAGPAAPSGPYLLQVFARAPDGEFAQVYAGSGAAFSPLLGAWCIPEAGRLRIAMDRDAASPWLTAAEDEARQRQAALREKDAVTREKDAALRRVAELEAELARRTR